MFEYAWGDPGDSIQTGQKRNPNESVAVPESGSLGLLALGAAGVDAWHNRRAQDGSAIEQ